MSYRLSPNPFEENPKRKTRLQQLEDLLPSRFMVRTWSPGDGVTRYRFFENAPPNQSYFGPQNGIYTALGYKEAYTFAEGLAR